MNPCTTWDVTARVGETTPQAVIEHLTGFCREWAFQKEQGVEGFVHWQMRLHLRRKLRFSQAHTEICHGPLEGAHISPTTTHCMGDDFYVLKADTRIEGPWTSKDAREESMDEPGWDEAGRSIEATLYPWQRLVIDLAKEKTLRTIYYVLDEGNTGKSSLANLMEARGLACIIPPNFRDGKDVMRMVMNTRQWVCKMKHNTYIIDIPRSVEMKKLIDIWGAIETVKNGRAYDDRYKFRQARFPPPNIFVFCNTMPPMSAFTADRWRRIE